jgi:hypothetical protein
MSKIGFPEKVLGKTKICDYPLFRKVEQNRFFKKSEQTFVPFSIPKGKRRLRETGIF